MSHLSQDFTPICAAIEKHIGKNKLAYHTPGHKLGKGAPSALLKSWGKSIWQWDLTELEGLDNLLHASGSIDLAAKLVAQLYGVEQSILLTQGSTVGILASVLGLAKKKKAVILPRNSHVSAFNALILADADPYYISVKTDSAGRSYGIDLNEFQQRILNDNVSAVLLVYPSYDGIAYDLQTIIEISHQAGVPVIVDEAHGAHLHFSDELPPSAVDLGADIVVQSVHKSLPCLTGGAWMHLQGSRVSYTDVLAAVRLVHSTSPSYLIMAALDACRYLLAHKYSEELSQLFTKLKEIREFIKNLEYINILPAPKGCIGDITKLNLQMALGDTNVWHGVLQDDFGIFPEKVEGRNILFMFTTADLNQDFALLEQALKNIDHQMKKMVTDNVDCPHYQDSDSTPPQARLMLTPREVYDSNKRWIDLSAAVGHICANAVMQYPPGIPIILPGELVNNAGVVYCQKLIQQGVTLQGLRSSNTGIEMLVVSLDGL